MQRNPLLLTLLSLRAYSWFWSLSGTRDTHLLPPVLMLKMSAYQVFSDTQLPTPTCIIKMPVVDFHWRVDSGEYKKM